MTHTIDTALAVSFIIGAFYQTVLFISSLVTKYRAGMMLEEAREASEKADEIAAEAEKIHNGAMMCLKMSNELFYCHTSDERADIIIKWMPKLQESGISMQDIDSIINS